MSTRFDAIIVGSGAAGLYCALSLPKSLKVALVTKKGAKDCDSYLAQGGMCTLTSQSDFGAWFEDTMKAGRGENDPKSVEIMIRGSREVRENLVSLGVRFERDSEGNYRYTREGGHSAPRILFHKDITGEEIVEKLLAAVRTLDNVKIFENTTMIDLVCAGGSVDGVICATSEDSPYFKFENANSNLKGADEYFKFEIPTSIRAADGSRVFALRASSVVLATGGVGGLYPLSTNFTHIRGDALGVALRRGIALRHASYVQIHPTALYEPRDEKSGIRERVFLVSESVRGEGGKLLDANGERFTDELAPRDVVSAAILERMRADGTPHVWLDMRGIAPEVLKTHFENIYKKCCEIGYDPLKKPIPVVPAQHYHMGGIATGYEGRASLKGLYAVGEVACNAVHGANRLASNSLLESMVFASRAAADIASRANDSNLNNSNLNYEPNLSEYFDVNALFEGYEKAVWNAVKKEKE